MKTQTIKKIKAKCKTKKIFNGCLFFILIFLFTGDFCFSEAFETLEEEAARRLPPVLYSLEMPEVFVSGHSHTVEWSILGYHDNYKSSIYFFDCSNTSHCGAEASSNFENSGRLNVISVEQGSWSYNGFSSKIFNYKYEFTPPFVAEPTNIVVRFYRINNIDEDAGSSGLSLLIPGNVTGRYYDNEGRRILKTVAPPVTAENLLELCLLDNIGVTLRRTGNTFYHGPERLQVYELILENYDAYWPDLSIMEGTVMFAYPDYGVKFHNISIKGSYFSNSWHETDFSYDSSSCGESIIDFVLGSTLGAIHPVLGPIYGGVGAYQDCFSNSSLPQPYSSKFYNHSDYDTATIPFQFGTLQALANKVKILFAIGPKEGQVLDDSSFNFDIFLQYNFLYGSKVENKNGIYEKSLKLPLY